MLKAQEIKDAKHSGIGKAPLKLSDGGGLQLHVFANGRKTWIYSYRFQGKQKNITLGKYPQMTTIVAMMCAEKNVGFNLINYRYSLGVYHEQKAKKLYS
nr:DUF4102 domain-containing protein [Acinetobacter sp.]